MFQKSNPFKRLNMSQSNLNMNNVEENFPFEVWFWDHREAENRTACKYDPWHLQEVLQSRVCFFPQHPRWYHLGPRQTIYRTARLVWIEWDLLVWPLWSWRIKPHNWITTKGDRIDESAGPKETLSYPNHSRWFCWWPNVFKKQQTSTQLVH